jgi:hypothetical protein
MQYNVKSAAGCCLLALGKCPDSRHFCPFRRSVMTPIPQSWYSGPRNALRKYLKAGNKIKFVMDVHKRQNSASHLQLDNAIQKVENLEHDVEERDEIPLWLYCSVVDEFIFTRYL